MEIFPQTPAGPEDLQNDERSALRLAEMLAQVKVKFAENGQEGVWAHNVAENAATMAAIHAREAVK